MKKFKNNVPSKIKIKKNSVTFHSRERILQFTSCLHNIL